MVAARITGVRTCWLGAGKVADTTGARAGPKARAPLGSSALWLATVGGTGLGVGATAQTCFTSLGSHHRAEQDCRSRSMLPRAGCRGLADGKGWASSLPRPRLAAKLEQLTDQQALFPEMGSTQQPCSQLTRSIPNAWGKPGLLEEGPASGRHTQAGPQ